MNRTKIALGAVVLGLGLTLGLSFVPESASAKCVGGLNEKNGKPCGGGGGGGGGATACKIHFDASFEDAAGDGVLSDGGSLYQDGVNRMMIATGSGPGFRFDTNGGSQKLEGAGGVRQLGLIVPAFLGSLFSGVDLRFHLSDGGLDLCSLAAVGDTGQVGLNILFEDDGGTKWTVNYSEGCMNPNLNPNLEIPFISSPVDVTRTGADTWTIEGVTACVVEYDVQDAVEVYDDQHMPFLMTITAQ